jgi:hypothetical protein
MSLGGAALAGLAPTIGPQLGVPVLCSVEVGAVAALALARQGAKTSGDRLRPTESVGLSSSLARLLGGIERNG